MRTTNSSYANAFHRSTRFVDRSRLPWNSLPFAAHTDRRETNEQRDSGSEGPGFRFFRPKAAFTRPSHHHEEVTSMATFRTGQQTRQAVLPHPSRRPSPPSDASGGVLPALEPVPADSPRTGNETGHGHHRPVVPGAGHGRGETTGTSPDAGGVTPNPEGVGEQHREVRTIHPSVFVLDKDHVHPRSRSGSDPVSNPVLACVPCNQAKDNLPVEQFVTNRRTLNRVLAQAKAPLRDAAAMNSTRWALWRALEQRLPAHVGSGGRTERNRVRNHRPRHRPGHRAPARSATPASRRLCLHLPKGARRFPPALKDQVSTPN